jgi:hypothetical protein
MARPAARVANTALPTGPTLAPAPGNGVEYADRQPPPAPTAPPRQSPARTKVRDWPQLGTRVPPALYDRIQRCTAETGVSQAFLVQRAVEHELTQRGY